jgi:hypothetical protein
MTKDIKQHLVASLTQRVNRRPETEYQAGYLAALAELAVGSGVKLPEGLPGPDDRPIAKDPLDRIAAAQERSAAAQEKIVDLLTDDRGNNFLEIISDAMERLAEVVENVTGSYERTGSFVRTYSIEN